MQLKNVFDLYDMEIHQKISMPNHQKLKTMGKRNIDQKLRLRNFDARHGRIETGAVVKNRKGLSGERGAVSTRERDSLHDLRLLSSDQCSNGDRCSFHHEAQDRAQKTRTHCRHAFRAKRITRSKCVEEKKYPRQK